MHADADDLFLCHALAEAAGAVILPHFRALAGVDNKDESGFDPVTVADRAAEARMREILAVERPDDGVLGEEFDARPGTSGRTWILDPIDGTRAFIMGLPTWGILIALADASGPRVGLMAQPLVGDTFSVGPDGVRFTSRLGEHKARTRGCGSLGEATLATTSPHNFAPEMRQRFERLAGDVRMVRYGTDCYHYALLAAGHIDIVVETGLKPVDVAPFVPMVERAGGAITDLSGRPIGPSLLAGYSGEAVAVGDPALLGPVLEHLAKGSA
jgi:histidinol phosphatase-like enzyme (inositol monophosphatase family)